MAWGAAKGGPELPSRNKHDVTHSQLKDYESKRRLAYSSKLESTSLYWKSYRDLLSAALQETKRAHRLVLGTCRAYQVYADALNNIHSDTFLDEKFNIANEKNQKRLANARKMDPETEEFTQGKKESMFSKVQATHKTVAEKFGENGNNMDEEIAEAIGSLYNDVQTQFSTMDALGSSVIAELERTEQEVTSAWGAYLPVAHLNDDMGIGGSLQASTTQESAKIEKQDLWLVETQYRIAAAYQNTAWAKGSEELEALFQKVKQEEILRRMNLREFLVAFVQRQQRMFLSLPGIQNKVLEDLVSEELTKEEIEKNVKEFILSRTNTTEDEKISASNLSSSGLNLQSPLTSDLLLKASVVMRKGISGVAVANSADLKVSLAIMTADSYVHFFDIDDSKSSLASSPESLLQVLMPSVIIPNQESTAAGRGNFAKGWSDSLTPSDSVVLARCTIQKLDETSFVIVEKGVGGSTASKMFSKFVDKKIQVKCPSIDATNDWIEILSA